MIGQPVGKNWTGQFVKCYKNRLKSLYLYNIDKDQIKAEYPPVFEHFYKLVGISLLIICYIKLVLT
jgi:hypothetical protein